MIKKNEPQTKTEKELYQASEKTFLSLWSYPSVFKDQGGGKEVCDLLVVFNKNVLVISDKNCAYPDDKDAATNWNRWFKRSIISSKKQLDGAVRWISEFPQRIYVDEQCNTSFPISIPSAKQANFYRIIVVHNIQKPCENIGKLPFGLKLSNNGQGIFDTYKIDSNSGKVPDFTIKNPTHKEKFYHIIDFDSVKLMLTHLSTIKDFISYLDYREGLFKRKENFQSESERALLGNFLLESHMNNEHSHKDIESNAKLSDEIWKFYTDQEIAQKEDSAIDLLIEHFSEHALNNTLYRATDNHLDSSVKILQFLASEDRVNRNEMDNALITLLNEKVVPGSMRMRVTVLPNNPERLYVFILFGSSKEGLDYSKHRQVRLEFLRRYCYLTCYRHPESKDIIGFVFDSDRDDGCSEDAVYFQTSLWNDELEKIAIDFRDNVLQIVPLNEVRK